MRRNHLFPLSSSSFLSKYSSSSSFVRRYRCVFFSSLLFIVFCWGCSPSVSFSDSLEVFNSQKKKNNKDLKSFETETTLPNIIKKCERNQSKPSPLSFFCFCFPLFPSSPLDSPRFSPRFFFRRPLPHLPYNFIP